MTHSTVEYPRVACPSCETEFPIDPGKVPEGGVHARCSICEHIFFVERPSAEAIREGSPDEEGEEPGAGITVQEPEIEALEPAAEVSGLPEPAADVSEPVFDVPEPTIEGIEPSVDGPTPVTEVSGPDAAPPISAAEVAAPPTEVPEPEADRPEEEEPPRPDPGSTAAAGLARFARQDPHERAKRIARVLVSDMMTYNPDLYDQAMERGTLAEDFGDEVEKSWEEYVERVGPDLANDTTYFRDALNEILARGETIF